MVRARQSSIDYRGLITDGRAPREVTGLSTTDILVWYRDINPDFTCMVSWKRLTGSLCMMEPNPHTLYAFLVLWVLSVYVCECLFQRVDLARYIEQPKSVASLVVDGIREEVFIVSLTLVGFIA